MALACRPGWGCAILGWPSLPARAPRAAGTGCQGDVIPIHAAPPVTTGSAPASGPHLPPTSGPCPGTETSRSARYQSSHLSRSTLGEPSASLRALRIHPIRIASCCVDAVFAGVHARRPAWARATPRSSSSRTRSRRSRRAAPRSSLFPNKWGAAWTRSLLEAHVREAAACEDHKAVASRVRTVAEDET